MEMTSGLFMAICAGVTLLILFGVTLVTAVIWIVDRINKAKEEILDDFDLKHKANEESVAVLHELVIRHDVLLNAEFGTPLNGSRSHLRG